MLYLRASSDAWGWGNGTSYAFEITNPTFSGNNCSATLNIMKVVPGDGVTQLGTTTIPCHDGMQAHAIVYGNNLQYDQDGKILYWIPDSFPIASGQPGIGGRGCRPATVFRKWTWGGTIRHRPTPSMRRRSGRVPSRITWTCTGRE